MQQVSVGLSLHRPEMMPFIAEWMRQHDAILLEEPHSPGFDQMIRGQLPVDDYLLTVDVDTTLYFSPDPSAAWVGKAACGAVDDLFEDFGKT